MNNVWCKGVAVFSFNAPIIEKSWKIEIKQNKIGP